MEVYICQACGRAAQAIEGHDRYHYCYGCGAKFMDQHKRDDPLSRIVGPFHRVKSFRVITVEFPGDIRYDPWTGNPMENLDAEEFSAVTLENWQLAKFESLCA